MAIELGILLGRIDRQNRLDLLIDGDFAQGFPQTFDRGVEALIGCHGTQEVQLPEVIFGLEPIDLPV
ncbi:hypothetical protein NKH72_22290 [Mesorhizobium sp. M0955]|uniref:hypothetical protein n=1 Tax=Mesorhizobium sp. M0955 TaxID=2957033 RepID=UPI00333617D8